MKKIYKVMILATALGLLGCEKKVQPTEQAIISNANNYDHIKLNSERMLEHLKAFQKIAVEHGGNRAVGTSGGIASAQYIIQQAKALKLDVETIDFETREQTKGQNILVKLEGQSKENVIILGAHYDSVKMGPGINDNASGLALLLELMKQFSEQKIKPKHTIYFGFWDSEEVGIAGSQDYVKKLSPAQLKAIAAYINVDMVGTKDPNILIADADKSSVDEMEKTLKENGMQEADYKPLLDGLRSLPSHKGDLALENTLKDFFKKRNLVIKEDVSTLTASDTAPFLGKVPVTSVILFNEQMKGNELYFAPCYHQACDTIDLVDPKSMQLAGDAIIHILKNVD